jgi:hypothetical protein
VKTIKAHSHEDRERIMGEMIPYIKKKFGTNLVALAACCSFARNEDNDYSDLELIAFVKKMPKDRSRDGLAKIYDGLLIELIWMTRETYLKYTLDVNEYWHYSGSDKLLPILNQGFIDEIAQYRPKDLKKQCMDQAIGCFTEVQEAVSKVLNAINQNNHEGMPLLFFEMVNQCLRILSFLNQIPFTTASQMIAQARNFPFQPASLGKLLDIAVKGEYGEFETLRKITIAVFEELEALFESLGLPLMDDNLDPNKLVHRMRQMQ